MPVSLQRDLVAAGGVGIVGAGLLFGMYKLIRKKSAHEMLVDKLLHEAKGVGFTKHGARLLFQPDKLEEYRAYYRNLSIPDLETALDKLQIDMVSGLASEDDQKRAKYLFDTVTDMLVRQKGEKVANEKAFREKIWQQMDEAANQERERLLGPQFSRLISTMSEEDIQKLYRQYANQFIKRIGNPEYLQLRMWKLKQVADEKKFTLPDYDQILKQARLKNA